MANLRAMMSWVRTGWQWLRIVPILLPLVVVAGCSGTISPVSTGTGGARACTDCTPTGDMTYVLPSPAGAVLWTTTTMDKVLREAAPPTATGTTITLSAAKNEFEPFQIVIRADSATTATLQLSAITGSSSAVTRTEIRRVRLRLDTAGLRFIVDSKQRDPRSAQADDIRCDRIAAGRAKSAILDHRVRASLGRGGRLYRNAFS